MRHVVLAACLSLLTTAASAQIVDDPAAPRGKLPDAARPVAYRLDMTILPDEPRFSGHDEIDAVLKAPTKRLYLHGRDLHVGRAVARVGGSSVVATWAQVDPSGVARLDFPTELPAGPVTLVFDFEGAFADIASGLFRTRVGDRWYSWSQFESIDARAAFPSFDEPGFKTPFTISITTRAGLRAVSNAPETAVGPAGELEKHVFAPTAPLPTYLVAMVTGPFVRTTGEAPANAIRAQPLPLGIVATAGQAGKMDYAMAETPRIVALLEAYFGSSFPFPKLDQIASPMMGGAMENAGADIYADPLILLDAGASTRQKQDFGAVVAHELSHQWFGDLVTPVWWDDIWLNESFANWMGYRIGNEWRPELNIGVNGLADGFAAMNVDSLEVGRPIHQPIRSNGEIDSAFDEVTYGKGGHVVAMMAAYLGDERFRDGVRLHLSRHRYGNADSEQFFASLADAAKDPRILAAMKSFVDQQGVPVVDFRRQDGKLVATQSRYAFLGSTPRPAQWTIPVCLRADATRICTLLDAPTKVLDAPLGVLIPNAGGNGYYRFNLQPADWQALIAQAATLPAAEAIALDDSLWAAFYAGKAPVAWLIEAARTMSSNPDSGAAIDGGRRLAGLTNRGLVPASSGPAYRRVMASIYVPRLTAIGFDPAAGAQAGDSPDRQRLRQSLVRLVVEEAREPAVRARLRTAADAYLAGDADALDQSLLAAGLRVAVDDGGVPVARTLMQKLLASDDAIFRRSALDALGGTGRGDVAAWLLDFTDDRLHVGERIGVIRGLALQSGTQELAGDWLLANFDKVVATAGPRVAAYLSSGLASRCGVESARHMSEVLGPKLRAADAGVLPFERIVESVRHCGDLRAAKNEEIAAALAQAR